MRIVIALLSLFLLMACDPKKSPPASPPTVDERVGIYQDATVYAGSTDYAFEINDRLILVRVSNFDSLDMPDIPSNLTIMGQEGPPEVNPVLVGSKYALSFGPQEQLKSIKLLGNHDPSDVELPALPENYSGFLSVGPASDSRAYLQLSADLTANLIIHYEENERPLYKTGRWTRTNKGQYVSAQFGDENWQFIVKDGALVLVSNQMGSGRLTLMANNIYNICYHVQSWLSTISTIGGKRQVKAEDITNNIPLSDILRSEKAYLRLYEELENIYKVEEETTAKALRANPTVQAVCDLVMKVPLGGEGH